MTLQVESLQPGEDRAAGPAADPVWHPWCYPDSRSIPSRRGQLEAFCLHLLQFMNPPSGAQSRLCLWVSVTGRWGQGKKKKKKKTLFFSPFSWKHTQKHTHLLHQVWRAVCQSASQRTPLLQKSTALLCLLPCRTSPYFLYCCQTIRFISSFSWVVDCKLLNVFRQEEWRTLRDKVFSRITNTTSAFIHLSILSRFLIKYRSLFSGLKPQTTTQFCTWTDSRWSQQRYVIRNTVLCCGTVGVRHQK